MKQSKKNILILGASGFIGGQLTKYLFDKKYSISILCRNKNNLSFDNGFLPRARVKYGDYSNRADLRRALKNIDIVINLIPSCAFKNDSQSRFSNLSKAISLDIAFIEECNSAGIERVIFASSGGTIYGRMSDGPMSEKDLTEPVSEYGLSKLFFEQYLFMNSLVSNLQYTVLRISNPYGVGQSPFKNQGVIAKFMWKIIQKEEIEIYGDILSGRDYIYISDLINAFEKVINLNSFKSNIYNIGSGTLTTLEELVDSIQKFSSTEPCIEYLKAKQGAIHSNYLDISLSASELNWRPKVSLKEGLLLTHDYLSSIITHG